MYGKVPVEYKGMDGYRNRNGQTLGRNVCNVLNTYQNWCLSRVVLRVPWVPGVHGFGHNWMEIPAKTKQKTILVGAKIPL